MGVKASRKHLHLGVYDSRGPYWGPYYKGILLFVGSILGVPKPYLNP